MPAATAVGVASTSAGTRHNEHRDAPRDVASEPERDGCRHEHCRDKIAGVAIGKTFHRGLGGLGVLHQVDDPLERGVVAQSLDGQFQRPVGIERSGKDLVARLFFDGRRLAGDGALVHPRRPGDNPAVDRYSVAGPDEHHVVGSNVGNMDFVFLIAAANAGGMGPQFQQAGDSRSSVADGEVFQGLADEHDEHHFRSHEKPRRRVVAAPTDPESGHGSQADGQIGGDLAACQAADDAQVGGKSANQGQQHGKIEVVDRSQTAGHVRSQSRPHGQREQQVAGDGDLGGNRA